MDKERYIFEKFRSKLNGDDCAVIGERAYCKDLFVEGVHFRRGWLSLREIGAKAMLVNISDMIATNARAKYALLGLALPREIGTREIDELCAGVSETAREWGIRIIGGDTIGSDRIALSVSLIGKCKRPVFRSGARVGDLIAHTGELGSVGRDLAVLLRDEISPASSQTQNRNDKISSVQSSSTAPQGLNAETSTAQNPGDEVRSPDDKISLAHARLQSLDNETSAIQILDLEPQSLDDKILPAYVEPLNLDAENSAENSVSQSRKNRKDSTSQSLACENSAPQSQAYEGSVFDLRAKISKNSRFVRPVLRDKFFYKAAKFISAAMDISDGLAQDLPRLLEASGVGARWIARPSEAALQSGEEYEILFSFAPKFLPKIYAIAAKTGVAINIIAEVCPRTPQSSMEFRGSSHHFAP
ncbi:thiamine-phosphate kinase [Campylobacter gracilis]|uniref:Thiamine-monophosphate kinase n=1 Tax=Campylobacter gracilis RM3268 TaxID=553220 RepID=C8PEU3_9BACT|nr:thiamine-phosphate kinase [Campylobacter gracilis]AKT91864.1 thiamine monophosphate kinase [Campylobacter gracilis]EEV18571.1 putative thiamine-phosphate kinase [Campylobacter gracilis RM3268]UEB45932.1 thiamine-phosphate kinase [Campylobacter gracilis]SUW77685.1 thiamine monophosphate kinase [Campylobacter gracilis]